MKLPSCSTFFIDNTFPCTGKVLKFFFLEWRTDEKIYLLHKCSKRNDVLNLSIFINDKHVVFCIVNVLPVMICLSKTSNTAML